LKKKMVRLEEGSNGISTFGLTGGCQSVSSSSPAVIRGRRRFGSPGFEPFRKVQSHFMKLDLLSVCSDINMR
jgi:hypothetical protein